MEVSIQVSNATLSCYILYLSVIFCLKVEITNLQIVHKFKWYSILAEFNVYLCIYGVPTSACG